MNERQNLIKKIENEMATLSKQEQKALDKFVDVLSANKEKITQESYVLI